MTLTSAVFGEPVQLVRMGALDGHVLHLRHAGEDLTDDIALTTDEERLLRQMDPTVFSHRYRPAERQALLDMASRDMLRIVLPGSGIGAYDWALDIDGDVRIVANPFDAGYICIVGGVSFNLVDLGRPVLALMDGTRTVGEATDEVQNEILSGPAGRDVLADALAKTGRPFYQLLCDAGMSLTKGLLATGAGSCLPVRRPTDLDVAA